MCGKGETVKPKSLRGVQTFFSLLFPWVSSPTPPFPSIFRSIFEAYFIVHKFAREISSRVMQKKERCDVKGVDLMKIE